MGFRLEVNCTKCIPTFTYIFEDFYDYLYIFKISFNFFLSFKIVYQEKNKYVMFVD